MSDTLLIIDDDDLICETLYDIFQEKDYDVTLANTGQEAIEKVEKIGFNIVFIDIRLPDIDGITLLKKIKKTSPDSICVIVTAYGTLQNAIDALKDGADGYFLKPLMIHDIIERVHELLEKKRLERELKKSEEKFRHIIENAKEGYYELDLKGNFTFFNKSLCEQLRYSPEELMGMNYKEYTVEEDWKSNFKAFNQVYTTGIGQDNLTYKFITKDEKRIFGEYSVNLRYDSTGRKIGFSGFLRDITKRKQAEQKLRSSEERLLNAQRIAHIGNWNWDIVKNNLIWSDEIYRIFSLTPKEFGASYEAFLDSVYPDDKEFLKKNVHDALYENKPYSIDHRIILPDGSIRYVHEQAEVVFDKSGKPIRMDGTVHDITERMQAELKLKESEEKYRGFVNNISDVLTEVDLSGTITYVSPQFYDTFGYTPQEVIGQKFNDFIDPDDLIRIVEKMKETIILRKPVTAEFGSKHKNGTFVPVFVKGGIILSGKKEKIIAIVRDFTEKKQAELKLKESEEKFRAITEQSLAGISIFQNNKVQYVNQQGAESLGYHIDEIKNWKLKDMLKTIHPKDRHLLFDQFQEILKGSKDALNIISYRTISKTGKTVWVENLSNIITYRGKPAILATTIDITGRKQVEQKLKESEVKSRNIINNISDVLMECKIDGTMIFVSPQIFDIVGYHPNELIGFKFIEFIHPEEKNLYGKLINKPQKAGDKYAIELRVFHKKGYYVPISLKGSFEKVDEKLKSFIVIRDVTERRKMDEMMKREILKLQELDQIRSDLIRRISHELKTPLISIFSGSQYLLEHIDTNHCSDQVQDIIKLIHMGGYRLRSLVNNLIITYNIESDEIKLKIKKENLIPVIKNCVEDLVLQINKRKNFINLELLEELYIKLDKLMIKRVISNILSNAVKNTPTNGNIIISTFEHPEYVDIIVKDDGVGLTEDENLLLFKKFGKIERYGEGMDVDIEGAGLGLYIANEIVKLHNGEIIVKSKGRNMGSKFIIRLPIN